MLLSFWPRPLFFFPKSAVKRFSLLPAAALRQTDVCLSVCRVRSLRRQIHSAPRPWNVRKIRTPLPASPPVAPRAKFLAVRTLRVIDFLSGDEACVAHFRCPFPDAAAPRLWSMGHLWPGLLIYKMTQSSLCRCCCWYAQYARQKPTNPPVWRARPAPQYSE